MSGQNPFNISPIVASRLTYPTWEFALNIPGPHASAPMGIYAWLESFNWARGCLEEGCVCVCACVCVEREEDGASKSKVSEGLMK